MKFTVHSLELHRAIEHPEQAPADDGTQAVFSYCSKVKANELEPNPSEHLCGGNESAVIHPGHFLFAQGSLHPSLADDRIPSPEQKELFRRGAEAVWLEALWRDLEFKNDRILVRILSEDEHDVFQIFREIEKPAD